LIIKNISLFLKEFNAVDEKLHYSIYINHVLDEIKKTNCVAFSPQANNADEAAYVAGEINADFCG
jgi:hypothetical protein